MIACIILHLMFQSSNKEKITKVHMSISRILQIPTNIVNMMGVRTRIRDRQIHQQLKNDFVEHIYRKFGGDEDNN